MKQKLCLVITGKIKGKGRASEGNNIQQKSASIVRHSNVFVRLLWLKSIRLGTVSKYSPIPDEVTKAVQGALELLGSHVNTTLKNSLKGKLDIANIRTMGDVNILEQELRMYFGSGSKVVIRRLRAGLLENQRRGQLTLVKKVSGR